LQTVFENLGMENVSLIVVDLAGMTNGKYEFDFKLDKSILEKFANDIIEGCQLELNLILHKSDLNITVTVQLDGEIDLVCDRSLEVYQEPIHEVHKIVFKLGNHWEELSEEMFIIPADVAELVFDQIVYDILCTAVPMKKLHPKYRNNDEDIESNSLVFQTSQTENLDKEEQIVIDPRWEALKKLNLN